MFSLVTARNDPEQRLPPLVNGNACPGENLCRSRIQGFFELEITRPKIQKLRLGARRQNVPIPKAFWPQDIHTTCWFHLISKLQTELSWSYFLRLRRLGPLGSTPGFHWVQRQEIPAVLQGAVAVWEFEWSSRDHVRPIGYDYDKCSFHKAVIFHVLLATVAYFYRDENTGAMRRF